MDALGVTITAVGAALFLAVVIERVTEAFVAPFVPERYSAYIPFGTLGLGLLGAFAFGVDVVTPTFEALGASPPYAVAGQVLTGILAGGGSNLIHDLWPGSAARESVRPALK